MNPVDTIHGDARPKPDERAFGEGDHLQSACGISAIPATLIFGCGDRDVSAGKFGVAGTAFMMLSGASLARRARAVTIAVAPLFVVVATIGLGPVGMTWSAPPDQEALVVVPVAVEEDDHWRTASDELGEYIQQLERHLAWMQRWASFRKDADTLKAVERLQKKLAVAKIHHRELCRLCDQELKDTPTAAACCQSIDKAMHEVIDGHLDLMRRLLDRPQRGPK